MSDGGRPLWRSRLVATAIGLSIGATFLAAIALGWHLHAVDPGKPVSIVVKRPLRVSSDQDLGSDTAPNVLGLDEDTARQAMLDAGITPGAIAVKTTPYAGEGDVVVDQDPKPGAAHPKSVTLVVSTSAPMPRLIGRSVDDARNSLSAMGARVIVTTRFQPSAKEGIVLSTSPAPGAPLKTSATLTVAEAPSSVFLSDLESLTSGCSTGEITMDAHDFKNSLSCSVNQDSSTVSEYLLNRRVATFSATAGLSDRADRGTVRFRVVADGHLKQERVVRFGQVAHFDAPVAGALRLRIVAKLLSAGASGTNGVTAGWGNARFNGGKKAIDALVASSKP